MDLMRPAGRVFAPSFLTTWRTHAVGWSVVGVVIFIDAVWLSLSDRAMAVRGLAPVCTAGALLFAIAILLRLLIPMRSRRDARSGVQYGRLSDAALWGALFIAFTAAAGVLSYLCVTLNAPLIDDRLNALDQLTGFDWIATYYWVRAHRYVETLLEFAYASGIVQLIGLILFFALSGRQESSKEFFFEFVIATAWLLAISTPFPAASAYLHFHVDNAYALSTVSHFDALRDGSLKSFDLTKMQGLVSMPSFHAALGVLFVYWLRNVRRLLYIAVPLNIAMIVSTPTQGGHYLVDVIAGVLLAALTVATSRLLSRIV
jgi:membrane-associated phospholipid phosphatase